MKNVQMSISIQPGKCDFFAFCLFTIVTFHYLLFVFLFTLSNCIVVTHEKSKIESFPWLILG